MSKWNEKLHPRGAGGKFTSKSGGALRSELKAAKKAGRQRSREESAKNYATDQRTKLRKATAKSNAKVAKKSYRAKNKRVVQFKKGQPLTKTVKR